MLKDILLIITYLNQSKIACTMFSNLVNRSCYGCDHIILYFANIKINSSKDFNHHKLMLVRLMMCMYVCILQNYFVSRKLSYLWYAAGGRI